MTMSNSVFHRVVGTGVSAGENLGLYQDADGHATTCRPEFAGQTVQMGNMYVTYNDRGYPERSLSVKQAKELGNDYTMAHFGIDQTKIANAGDIYRSIYNAAMQEASTVSGSELDNGYGKRNIQYDGALGLEDYDTLIQEAVSAGNRVLAGFYEDSRNALIVDKGLSAAQSCTYNGGWNYVDSGGGIANAHAGAPMDAEQPEQGVGGGWFAGLGKGDAEKEYLFRNYDALPLMDVLDQAALLGYDPSMENAEKLFDDLAIQMMTNGYVSPATLQRAEALKLTVPVVLRNLGMESSSIGIDALEMAIRNMQSSRNA